MRDLTTDWQPISIRDDNDLFIEVALAGGREEVGIADSIPFEQVTAVLSDVADKIGESLKACSPTKAAVELGMEFALKEGKLVGLIARGSAKANLKITLEWSRTGKSS